MTLRGVTVALLATVSALGWAHDAGAAGFQVRENSAAYQGTAFAGQAAGSEDLSVMYANPATLTQFSGSRVEGHATEIVPRAVFTGSATSTTTGAPVSGDGTEVDGGSFAFVPAVYGMTSITPDLKVGLAITSPYGLATNYEAGWVGRYNALRSELRTIDINPNVAYRVLPWLSLGAGVSAQYARSTLSRAIDFSAFAAPDGNFRVDGDSWGFGFNGGIFLQPLERTRIGLSYRSQVHHNLEGDADFTVAAPFAALFPDSDASAKVRSPATATASVTQGITPDLDLMATVQWTNWEVFETLLVQRDTGAVLTAQPENWRNSWFASLGASWRVNNQLTLRTGIAYDETPVKDAFRTARLPDQDRYWLSVGLGWQFTDMLSVDGGYTHVFIRNNSPIDETAPGFGGGRLVGTYDASIDIFSVSAKLRF
jgi:long-chain fatty acid transport protein